MVGRGPLCLCFSPEARRLPYPPPRLHPTPETRSASEVSPLVPASRWANPPPPEWQDAGWASAGWFQTPQQSRCWVLTVSCPRAWCLGVRDRWGPAHSLPRHLPSPSATPRTPTQGCCQRPQRTAGPGGWEVGGGGRFLSCKALDELELDQQN